MLTTKFPEIEIDAMKHATVRAEDVERHVERKTQGRIFGLHVECENDRLIVRGRCRTYYAKQLVQEAAMESLAPLTDLVNEITIG